MMQLRKYRSADCPAMAALFYDTVHTINARDYTPEQLDVWADGNVNLAAWDESFLAHETRVVLQDGRLVGFADLDGNYLDRLYVHHAYQGQGIAGLLCDALEQHAKKEGQGEVITHASITARPFFEKRGYRMIESQQVNRSGILLGNFMMKKTL